MIFVNVISLFERIKNKTIDLAKPFHIWTLIEN